MLNIQSLVSAINVVAVWVCFAYYQGSRAAVGAEMECVGSQPSQMELWVKTTTVVVWGIYS